MGVGPPEKEGRDMDLNLPKVGAFLCCAGIQQDVLSKNYDLRGLFQGFGPPVYPFGAEFLTFTRFSYEREGEFRIDITLFNENGEKVMDTQPRDLKFTKEIPSADLITAWRVLFPTKGTYIFKVFCNNLNVAESKVLCR
jgi:hypothetical protein